MTTNTVGDFAVRRSAFCRKPVCWLVWCPLLDRWNILWVQVSHTQKRAVCSRATYTTASPPRCQTCCEADGCVRVLNTMHYPDTLTQMKRYCRLLPRRLATRKSRHNRPLYPHVSHANPADYPRHFFFPLARLISGGSGSTTGSTRGWKYVKGGPAANRQSFPFNETSTLRATLGSSDTAASCSLPASSAVPPGLGPLPTPFAG